MQLSDPETYKNILCPPNVVTNTSGMEITVQLLQFSGIYLIIITAALILRKSFVSWQYRRFFFPIEFERSIFGGYRSSSSWKKTLLYIYVMYGIFYFKLSGAFFAVLISNCRSSEDDFYSFIAKIIDTVCDCSNFFVLMFIQNLYGSKWELLVRLGYPVVPKDQQEKFVNLCLKKSFIFTLIFFLMYTLMTFGFEFGGITFNYGESFSVYKFLKNFVIVTLIFQRIRLINYYKETSTYTKINQIISEEINIRIRVVEDYFPNENAIIEQVQKIKTHRDLSKWINSKIEGSELMIKDKLQILKSNNAKSRDPIPVNYKERHYLNNLVLLWLCIDSTVFSIVCFYLTIVSSSGDSTPSAFSVVLVRILMVISCLEMLMQPILFYNVLRDKRVLGQENTSNREIRLESIDDVRNTLNSVDSYEFGEGASRTSLLLQVNSE